MRKFIIVAFILVLPMLCFAQFKSQATAPSISQQIAKPTSNFILGFLNPDKLQMHHNFSMSYMTFGGQGMMINSYLNTIDYQISKPLWLRLNLGVMNSPYNSFKNPALNNTQFFGGAELNYRPTENTHIKIGVDMRPGFYYNRYYNPFDW
ncbi:MAG TPA: hypothetical protein ENK14_12945 [Caldithrix sp.]|nr:hypothetical protein [Caldithrix sp.]